MWFFAAFVFPVLMFLTIGLLKAPVETLKVVGMFLMVCATLVGMGTGIFMMLPH
jgi:hypothetical protein